MKTRLRWPSERRSRRQAQAGDLFARVMQLDPEHVEAAEPLSEIYFKREEWAPLVPLLEMLALRFGTSRERRQLQRALVAHLSGGKERLIVLPSLVLMFALGIWPQLVMGVINSTVVQMVKERTF